MKKNRFLLLTGMIVSLFAMSCSDKVMTEDELVAEAKRIHEKVMTIDTHIDINPAQFTDDRNPSMRLDDYTDASGKKFSARKVDLPKMEEGGLDVAFFIVYTGQTKRTEEGYAAAKAEALEKFEAIHKLTDKYSMDKIGFSDTAAKTKEIYASGKKVSMIGIENGYVIGKDITLVKKFRDLGARYMTLSHMGHNDICDSANPRSWDDGPEHNGVSKFGEEVIAEMNKVGMLVDVSHTSHKTLMDATKLSKAPVIASHSGVDGVYENPRNINDEGLLAIKENGGVIQLVAFNGYVKDRNPRREATKVINSGYDVPITQLSEAQKAEYDAKIAALDADPLTSHANVQDFVNHIDYAVKLIGIDHVGISSDFDGGGWVEGWNDASETFNVTLELYKRGYSEEDIAKIWSGNTLRILREAEEVANDLQ